MILIIKHLVLSLLLLNCISYQTNTPVIRIIKRGGRLFEGPHWSTAENALYWVDILGQNVYRLDAENNTITSRRIGYGPVSLVVTIKDYPKLILLTVRTEVYLLRWDSTEGDSDLRLLSVVDLGKPDNKCNDGKVDGKGRLWFGTLGQEVNESVYRDQATFYMMDQYNFLNPVAKVRPVTISNGIAWAEDKNSMFYIDTATRNVDVFDFNLENGLIRNRRTLFSFQSNNVTGIPDGMTIDSDGNLWVACFNGWKVIKICSRSGKLLQQYRLPVAQVTSVMWGGHDLSTLFVTTSSMGMSKAELNMQPEAGSLFAIEGTGYKGLPENQFIFPNADKY